MKTLARTIDSFAESLRRDYAQRIARDARAFKQQVVGQLRRRLPPGPGHPPSAAVTRAVEMRAQGKPWLEIYRQCIRGFATLGQGHRELAMIRLRAAVRSRRVRHKGKPAECPKNTGPGCTS